MAATKKRIVVGMSGGVDSSVTAALLAEQGHDVLGMHMQNWHDTRFIRGCSNYPEDRKDALRVARQIGIPFEVVNFAREYKQSVIDYFFAEYAAGRTPNPDILCNREIKFGMLLDWARDHGYDYVATGHYAQAVQDGEGSRLLRGVDRTKDQSYFLSQLSRDQLRHAIFPLGALKKKEVRVEAAKRDLPVAEKRDSQGICFIGEIDLSEFLKQRIPSQPGKVIDQDGEELGEHEGAAYYTIGQRKGLGVSKGVPMYVVDTDVDENTVTVGYDRDLYHNSVMTEAPHWVSGIEPTELEQKEYLVSIRYRMEPQPATVALSGDGLAISFTEEQRAPTPGQFAVLYDGEELVGSAVIR